jgi:hypothetical protein
MAIRVGAVPITWKQGGQMRRERDWSNPPPPQQPTGGDEAPLTLF